MQSRERKITADELTSAYHAVIGAGIPLYEVGETTALIERRLSGQSHDRARAIALRLQALAHVVLTGDLPETALKRSDNGIVLTADVLRLAAHQPLQVQDDQAFFDVAVFVSQLKR